VLFPGGEGWWGGRVCVGGRGVGGFFFFFLPNQNQRGGGGGGGVHKVYVMRVSQCARGQIEMEMYMLIPEEKRDPDKRPAEQVRQSRRTASRVSPSTRR